MPQIGIVTIDIPIDSVFVNMLSRCFKMRLSNFLVLNNVVIDIDSYTHIFILTAETNFNVIKTFLPLLYYACHQDCTRICPTSVTAIKTMVFPLLNIQTELCAQES